MTLRSSPVNIKSVRPRITFGEQGVCKDDGICAQGDGVKGGVTGREDEKIGGDEDLECLKQRAVMKRPYTPTQPDVDEHTIDHISPRV